MTLTVPTPHIEAPAGAFADTVLMPGDPLRARWIAEQFLERPQQVTALRGMLGFTGHYRGRRISVMGSGMGIPSCTLYATELIRGYGVRRLLRVGTCGAVLPSVQLGDLVLGLAAGTDSATHRLRFGADGYAAAASWPLLQAIATRASSANLPLQVGAIWSSDLFYGTDPDWVQRLQRMRILGIEMEAAGLYAAATEYGAEAAALLTVSDHLLDGRHMPPEERQLGLRRMVELGLEGVCGE